MRSVAIIPWIGAFLIIGAAPIGFLARRLNPGKGFTSSTGGIADVVFGVPTSTGWWGYLNLVGAAGCLGAVAFWFTVWWSGVLSPWGGAGTDRQAC